MQRNVIVLLLSTFAICDGLGRSQAVGVRGQLMCDEKPAVNVKVKLYDEDTLSMDELMASGKTDSAGKFELKGVAKEFTSIEPKINIYHDCDDGIKPCQRKLTVYIPSQYITNGDEPKRMFEFGVLQLAGKFEGEKRDCIN